MGLKYQAFTQVRGGVGVQGGANGVQVGRGGD